MSNPFEYAIRAGINLLRIYQNYEPLRFFGFFGFVLILIALLTYFYSTFIVGKVMDITVIVLFLAGIQIILFGFLGEMFIRGDK